MPTSRTYGRALLVVVIALSLVYVTWTLTRPPTRTAAFVPPPNVDVSSPTPPTMALIGDSYTAGTGASDPSRRWANLFADETGYEVQNLAVGGTGYTLSIDSDGQNACGEETCPDFATAAQGINGSPDIILVVGGRNDARVPAEQERDNITSFYEDLAAEHPDSRIIATNPLWDSTDPPASLQEIADDVESSVTAVGGTYLDVGQPLAGEPSLVSDDDVHPNDSGHAAIAAAIEKALDKL